LPLPANIWQAFRKRNGDVREEETPPFFAAAVSGRRRQPAAFRWSLTAPEEKCGDTWEEVGAAAR
jgi:hypothetical protein